VGLAVSVEHPVEAALGVDIQSATGQCRHDLPRWQRGELRLVAGQQDPLPLLLTESVRHMAVAPLAAVNSVPITCELTAPALQRGQTHAQQQGQLTPAGTTGHAFIEDLQSLPTIVCGRQSSFSSPQKA